MAEETILPYGKNLKGFSGQSKGKPILRSGPLTNGRNHPVVCRPQNPVPPIRPVIRPVERTILSLLRESEPPVEFARNRKTRRNRHRHRRLTKSLSMLNRKTLSVTLVAVASIAGTFMYTLWQGNGPARIANRQAQVTKDLVKVTEPMR